MERQQSSRNLFTFVSRGSLFKYTCRLVSSWGLIIFSLFHAHHRVYATQCYNIGVWNPKVCGSIPNWDSEFFPCPTLVTSGKTSFSTCRLVSKQLQQQLKYSIRNFLVLIELFSLSYFMGIENKGFSVVYDNDLDLEFRQNKLLFESSTVVV